MKLKKACLIKSSESLYIAWLWSLLELNLIKSARPEFHELLKAWAWHVLHGPHTTYSAKPRPCDFYSAWALQTLQGLSLASSIRSVHYILCRACTLCLLQDLGLVTFTMPCLTVNKSTDPVKISSKNLNRILQRSKNFNDLWSYWVQHHEIRSDIDLSIDLYIPIYLNIFIYIYTYIYLSIQAMSSGDLPSQSEWASGGRTHHPEPDDTLSAAEGSSTRITSTFGVSHRRSYPSPWALGK